MPTDDPRADHATDTSEHQPPEYVLALIALLLPSVIGLIALGVARYHAPLDLVALFGALCAFPIAVRLIERRTMRSTRPSR